MAPCESCHAGCCRSFAVPVTGADIITIERRLRLSFWDFVCRWADPTGQIAHGLVPHFFFPDMPETPFVICLMHSDSVFLPGTTKCRFLMEGPPDNANPLGQARCGIYGSRPSACRVFPTKFNPTGDLVVLCNVPTTARSGSHPAYDLCPREWELGDIDPVQSVQDLVITKYEISFFTEIARVWNQSPKPWNVFPDFLHIVYSNRVQREPESDERRTENEEAQTVPFFPSNRLGPLSHRAAA
jgi:Fe-S-cluster containining protein